MGKMHNVSGLSCLITGATNGIGVETAKALVRAGMHLTILCRNASKGEQLKADLQSENASVTVELLIADMAKLSDVRQAAETYLNSGRSLDLLINNAGVVNLERRVTEDGFEETFAVNHLAPFLLTNLLLPRLQESTYSRIVHVASDAHHFVRDMGFDDLHAEKTYKTFKVYGRSKLANMLFSRELAKRLEGSTTTTNAVHPGAVSTNLGKQNKSIMSKILPLLLKPFFKTPKQGAATSLYVALSPELDSVTGQYFANCKQTTPKPWGVDDQAATTLWQLSETMVGLPTSK